MEPSCTFDEALVRYIGQFGPGQWKVVAVTSLFQICNALGFLLWVFLCIDPIASRAWECTQPSDTACMAVWQNQNINNEDFCRLQPEQWQWTSIGVKIVSIIYCHADSLASRYNLVCRDAWKVQIANSFMFVGAFIGSGLFGALCDKIGRQKPLFLATSIVSAAAFLSTAAPNYWFVVTMRAITGIGAAGQSHCIFLLCTEITGPIFRGRASVGSLLFFTAGEFILVALAVALPNWRHLSIAAGSINAAALLLFPFIPESARWLLSQGRQQEAAAILQAVSIGNKSSMPTEPLICSRDHAVREHQQQPTTSGHALAVVTIGRKEHHAQHVKCLKSVDVESLEVELSGLSDKSLGSARAAAATGDVCRVDSRFSQSAAASSTQVAAAGGVTGMPMGFLQLLKTPKLLIRSCVLVVTWFSLLLAYYGITLGAGGIPGSVHVTFALGAAAEVVALLVAGPAVDKIGRHSVVSIGLLLGGAANLACANVTAQTAQAVLSAVGKFGCSGAESVIAIYTAELFPTAVRSTAMGIFNQASRCGSIAAPFMLMLGSQLNIVSAAFIPYMVFGGVSALAGLLVLLLPETLGAPMPESIEDLQQLQSIFTAKPWRQGCRGVLAFVFRTRAAARSHLPPAAHHRQPPSKETHQHAPAITSCSGPEPTAAVNDRSGAHNSQEGDDSAETGATVCQASSAAGVAVV